MLAPQTRLSSGFVATLMKDDKWFESIQYCQSPYPLTAPFSGEVYSDHFYLAYTLIDLPSAPQKCSVQSYVDDARQVISFKMKHIVNPFADLRDYLHRIGRCCSNNLICWIQAKLELWCLVAGQCIPDWSLPVHFHGKRTRTRTHHYRPWSDFRH